MKRTATLAAVAVLTIGGCSVPESTSDDAGPEKFEQTWETSYGDTTCGQWINEMNQHETFVASADMLLTGQQNDGREEGVPDDELIEEFKRGMNEVCGVEASMPISQVGSLLYVTERATFKP